MKDLRIELINIGKPKEIQCENFSIMRTARYSGSDKICCKFSLQPPKSIFSKAWCAHRIYSFKNGTLLITSYSCTSRNIYVTKEK
jgi:hypothetical protein